MQDRMRLKVDGERERENSREIYQRVVVVIIFGRRSGWERRKEEEEEELANFLAN